MAKDSFTLNRNNRDDVFVDEVEQSSKGVMAYLFRAIITNLKWKNLLVTKCKNFIQIQDERLRKAKGRSGNAGETDIKKTASFQSIYKDMTERKMTVAKFIDLCQVLGFTEVELTVKVTLPPDPNKGGASKVEEATIKIDLPSLQEG